MRFVATFPATVASVKTFITRTFVATFKTHRSSDYRSGFADTFNFILATELAGCRKLDKSGSQIFLYSCNSPPVAPPIAFKFIFIADDSYLYCLNDSGLFLWKISIDGIPYGITADGSKVAVSTENSLFVIQYDGTLLFKLNAVEPFGATSEDFSFFFAYGPFLYHIANDGSLIWKAETEFPADENQVKKLASPTIYENRIYTPAPCCHSANDGSLIWTVRGRNLPYSSSQTLALSNGKLFYTSSDICRISPDGDVEISASLNLYQPETDASASDVIYAFGDGLFKFSFSLELIWHYACSRNTREEWDLPPPSQTAHRDVVAVPEYASLLVIDNNGNLLWKRDEANLTHPAIY